MAARAHRPVIPRLDAMEPERPPPALLSELLEEIFLRVASPADLARASAACVSFRRLISSPAFLRRYRSVHPPPLLGFLHTGGFYPVEATHPSAPVPWTADFSLDFLPFRSSQLYDVRDGRVVVGCTRIQLKKVGMEMLENRVCWDLAVCDPLARRYLMLPPFTDDLLASVDLHNHDMLYSDVSLVPSRGTEDETSFSVICWMISRSETRLAVFIFSTSSGHWAAGTSIDWADLGLYGEVSLISGQCIYGCFYRKVSATNKLLKLDMNTMELCTYDLPPDHDKRNVVVVVESGEGKVGMFSAFYEGTSLEYYTLLQNGIEKSHKWHLKSTIPLPADYMVGDITGPAEGYIFLECIPHPHRVFFSLEIKSFKIERLCMSRFGFGVCPYFGFPPSMSPRRIQGNGED